MPGRAPQVEDGGGSEEFGLPFPASIARYLIVRWLGLIVRWLDG